MGYLGRRIGLSQNKGDSTPGSADGAVGGGILDLFAQGYFNREGNIFNAPSRSPAGMVASGGVTNDYSDGSNVYRSHTFTSSGTFQITELAFLLPNSVEFLAVAGGGGGGENGSGSSSGSGGGAGGFLTGSFTGAVASYAITVGAGGKGNASPDSPYEKGQPGTDTVLVDPGGPTTYTAAGGGGGGSYPNVAGDPGGSGGGGGGNTVNSPSPDANYGTGSRYGPGSPLTGTTPTTQGNPGGYGGRIGGGGGGAGGAGGAGSGATGVGGAGGIGAQNNYATGTNQYYAGGGGGGGHDAGPGPGGNGGGGAGGSNTPHPVDKEAESGVQGTGGGGGGPAADDGNLTNQGGDGGSGVVVVRYKIATLQSAKASGGAISFYGGKTIHTFTSSGTFTTPGTFNETCEYVAVGGGGAGGGRSFRGGGGGAGAYHHNSVPIDNTGPGNPVATTITIGGGGTMVTPEGPDGNGVDTTIGTGFSVTASGGGMGGGYTSPYAGITGGSGGGAGGYPGGSNPAAGTDPGPATGDSFPGTADDNTPSNGWGYRGGGRGSEGAQQGGGGGGAGGQGIPSDSGEYPSTYGYGGPGVQLPTTFRNPDSAPGGTGGTSPATPGSSGGLGYQNPTGTSWYVAGGGNGGGYSKPSGVNPSVATFVPAGGGGAGAINGPGNAPEPEHPFRNNGWPGAVNSGSGGGGASPVYQQVPGRGGSGLVLIAYPT